MDGLILPTESNGNTPAELAQPRLIHGETDITSDANYDGNGLSQTRDVGYYSPNHWGLYDMHGNVWEWTSDIRSLPGWSSS